MNIDVQTRGFTLTDALQAAITREAADLPALADCRRLQARLFDINGTRGGIDKGCLVTLQVSGDRRVLVATDFDTDLYRAIGGAFGKLRRALGATMRRTRTLRRRNAQRLAFG